MDVQQPKLTSSELERGDDRLGEEKSMSGETIRVLVFGGTGVGKTSLCNTLTGTTRPTDGGARGVTSKTHVYAAFRHKGHAIQVVDTVGLHEAESGTVPPEQAALQLVDLLKSSKEGFHLLVHVAKAGRITKQHEEDYEFFVDKMTDRNIPVVLALSGCENEEPMDSWVHQNGRHFSKFSYRALLATCFAGGGNLEAHYAPLRVESRAKVLDAITTFALPQAWKLYGEGTGHSYKSKLAQVWNDFVELAGLPAKYRAKVNESAYEFLKRIGVPKELAELAIKHIPDLIDELPVPGRNVLKILVRKVLGRALKSAEQKPADRPST